MKSLDYLLGRVDIQDDCMMWTAYCLPSGYGMTSEGTYPHRLMYEIFIGPIPPDTEIDHLCRNPSCINPEHLEAVTHLENVRRGEKAQRTHCIHGHEFTIANTRVRPNGTRACRTCVRERARRYYGTHA